YRLHSLLVLESLFFSVLPYTLHSRQRIHTRPVATPTPAPPWQDIPCTFAEADIWLYHAGQPTSIRLNLQVRLPVREASPEPSYPLIGYQVFRHYEPRLVLDYLRFPHAILANPMEPVGSFEIV